MYIVRNCDLDALFCLNSFGTLISLPLLFSVQIMQCISPQSVVTVGSDLGGHDDHCATLEESLSSNYVIQNSNSLTEFSIN
jgi:hypothetical protein